MIIKFPEPSVRYADDSYKAYSREQVENLLSQLGFDILLDEESEQEIIVQRKEF